MPLGTVATVQNLNKRVKRRKKNTLETIVVATVLHSEIRLVHSTEALWRILALLIYKYNNINVSLHQYLKGKKKHKPITKKKKK